MVAPVQGDLQGCAPPSTGRIGILGELEGMADPDPALDLVEAAVAAELVEVPQSLRIGSAPSLGSALRGV